MLSSDNKGWYTYGDELQLGEVFCSYNGAFSWYSKPFSYVRTCSNRTLCYHTRHIGKSACHVNPFTYRQFPNTARLDIGERREGYHTRKRWENGLWRYDLQNPQLSPIAFQTTSGISATNVIDSFSLKEVISNSTCCRSVYKACME